MESNPAVGLLGFWMMLQLMATLALLVGGIYLMFCLGRAASGLDRMANAMEDWVALQNAKAQGSTIQGPTAQGPSPFAPGVSPVGPSPVSPGGPTPPPHIPAASPIPTALPTEPRTEYPRPDESNRQF